MSSADFSRLLFQPEKRYTGAFLQQGRVLTDEDLNAHRRLDAEDERLTFRDIICAKGTPNNGFKIDALTPTVVEGESLFDFTAATGSYYLGGLRFSILVDQPESFLEQTDWLQHDSDPTALPHAPGVADLVDEDGNPTVRHDLVYLRAWEQTVSAVEDAELLERALGGPDTSVYSRRMRQLDVLTGVPGDCADAFAALVAELVQPQSGDTSGTPHEFDVESCELLSKARLTVTPTGDGPSDDLCKPAVQLGYLGADNQAIRVQLTATNRFIWGYDNASPLYRVQVTREDGLNRIRFLTLPRDEFAQPRAGQAVEIIRWGAILPNQEKVAELRGHLTTVETGYDPDERTIVVSQDVPGEWVDWLNDPAHAGYLNDLDEPEDRRYLYLRLWTGGSGDATEPDHAFTPGTPVELEGTGLSVTLSDFGLPDDAFVIAARPRTPDRVVPWALLQEAAPVFPRRFFGGLALLRWESDGVNVTSRVIDCRTRFRPLCKLKGCCTVIVGDGHSSHGEFSTIQDGIDALPLEEGGEVCVLPGTYEESVRIEGRQHVHIHGCGRRTRVVGNGPDPVFAITDSSDIRIRDLAVLGEGTVGIHGRADELDVVSEVCLENLHVETRDRAGIVVENGRRIAIRNCEIGVLARREPLAVGDTIRPEPAVYVQGEVLRVEGNLIEAVATEAAALRGFGGLHVGGDSHDVELRRNHIRGGNNHGIVLGSVVTREIEGEFPVRPGYLDGGGWVIIVDERGCIRIVPLPPSGEPGEPTTVIEAGPPLSQIRIIENLIENMGASGISVARFFEMEEAPDFITVTDLLIERNHIRNCMGLIVGLLDETIRDVTGYGGVALADVERLQMRGNRIEGNGANGRDPICGVFVLHGEGIAMDGNHILDNGHLDTPDDPLRPGRRGGIVLSLARAPVGAETAPLADLGLEQFAGARQTGFPAAHIHDNIVVAPAGRALEMIALGPVSVEGNEFTTKGSIFRRDAVLSSPDALTNTGAASNSKLGGASLSSALSYATIAQASNPVAALMDLLGGATVAIFNLGVSNEIYLQLFGLSGLFLLDDLPSQEAVENLDDPRYFVGGNILFNDNQVVLDTFGAGTTLTMSSVLLVSLDDISMQGNQCDCDLVVDIALLNAIVVGWSIRVADNRFKESLLTTLYSGVTFALMNETTDNQSTHCLFALGVSSLSNRLHNHALVQLSNAEACQSFGARLVQHHQLDSLQNG